MAIGETSGINGRKGSPWNWTRRALGYILAGAGLVWVFHDVPLRSLAANLVGIDWWWMTWAVVVDVLSYIFQGLRWQLLLLPVGRISILKSIQAIYAGLYLNEILPLRPGELARVFLVSRWLGADLVSILPSLAVERLMDGIWLAAALGVAAVCVHQLPPDLLIPADVFGLVVIGLVCLFLLLVMRRGGKGTLKPTDGRGLRASIGRFFLRTAEGIRAIGRSRSIYLALGESLLLLLFQALAFWLVMHACGLRLNGRSISFWVGFLVYLIVHLGTALPNTPANVGSYQFFTVLGLTLFGLEKAQAASFSVVVFLLLTIPLWILGFLALSHSGATLAGLREDIAHLLNRRVRS